ncbi:hypothetical protein [Winogradskyella psychrotolerans]|uniref:hypothetical protein n=1 Tax=Winogradskyella psychrotolerans TaxID=1344585 RepID=UPI001C079FC0|nr:hypothetical protein [Winogradskyella psychrotolerans]MBU2929756.1 hypothetical protein [Winogradskyella psychrotolerans]
MKFNKTFIFLLLIISCSDIKPDNQTSEFEKVLGIENVATLDFLVSDFENDFLKRQYPNLKTENAYRQFLIELRDEKTENWKHISEKARTKFKTSDLRLEMYEYPDSVWIIENSDFDKIESDSLEYIKHPVPYIKSRFKYASPDGTIEYSYIRSHSSELKPNSNFESIINHELNSPHFNYIGKYLQALESIKNKNKFYDKLFDVKKEFGYVSPKLTAFEMLDYGFDLNDELNRQIIVLELAY